MTTEHHHNGLYLRREIYERDQDDLKSDLAGLCADLRDERENNREEHRRLLPREVIELKFESLTRLTWFVLTLQTVTILGAIFKWVVTV